MFQSFIVFVLSVEKFKQTEITFLKQNNKMIIIFTVAHYTEVQH